MSVILDSLRRARGGSSAGADATRRVTPAAIPAPGARPIPAGLRSTRTPAVKRSAVRWKLLAPVFVIALGVWAIARLSMNLTAPASPTPPQTAAGAPAAKPTQRDVAKAVLDEFVPGVQLPKETQLSDLAPVPSAALKGAAAAATVAPPPPAAVGTAVTAPPSPSSTAAAEVKTPTPPAPKPVPRPAAEARPEPPPPVAPPAALPTSTVAAAPPVVQQNHFELGKRAQDIGNFQQAQMHYLNAIAADDRHTGARNNLAMMYAARGMTTDAVDLLRQAIRIDPGYLNARSNLAVVLMNAGRLEEAKAQLRAAIELAPRNVGLLVNLALVHSKDGQVDVARETLIRAIGIDPTDPDANYNLAALYDQAGSVSKAHEHYEKFLKYAGADQGERLDAVRRRLNEIAPRLQSVAGTR